MKNKEYKICKEACAKDGCYLPPENEFHTEVANTPQFIRAYFYLKGLKSRRKEYE